MDSSAVNRLIDKTRSLSLDERAAVLESECGHDAAIRYSVTVALAAEKRVPDSPRARLKPGDTMGPYRIMRLLGEGGVGAVYLAEQTAPVRREVALKIVKSGADTRDVLARFEAERKALALMSHRNVATVLDAGTTDDGQPYFVMEHVPGMPITAYCDAHRLGVDERLALMLQACHAIQHAHQKGIIHRDLKPDNVLVADSGDQPLVKVIDFGLAKSTQQKLTAETMHTQIGVFIGTPHYSSPEQVAGDSADVDTRADVYALGVILYELLVGRPPFDRAMFRGKTFVEVLNMLRELDPPPPIDRYRELGDLRAAIAANRSVSTRRLSQILKSDLAWVLERALQRDRNERYPSVSAFAGDITRYREDIPVDARPPNDLYVLGKMIARHRRLAGSCALLVVVAIVGALWGLRWNGLETPRSSSGDAPLRRAETILAALSSARGGDQAALESWLLAAAHQLQARYGGDPYGSAQVLLDLAARFRDRAPSVAAQIAELAASEADRIDNPLDRRGQRSMVELALARIALVSDRDAALGHAQRAVELQRGLPVGLPDAQVRLGEVEMALGLIDQASATFGAVIEAARDDPGRRPAALDAHIGRARIQVQRDGLSDAIAELEAARGLAHGLDDEAALARVEINRAAVLAELGRYGEAVAVYDAQLAAPAAIGAEAERAQLLNEASRVLIDYGDLDRALARGHDAMRLAAVAGAQEAPSYAATVGQVLMLKGPIDEAVVTLEDAAAGIEAVYGSRSRALASCLAFLAEAQRRAGNVARALDLARKARPGLVAAYGGGHWRVAVVDGVRGATLVDQGDNRRGAALMKGALESLIASNVNHVWMRILARNYTDYLARQGRAEEGKQYLGLTVAPADRAAN